MKRLLGTIALALLFASPLAAEEKILDYHSDVTVDPSGAMDVVETIRVVAEGQQIDHGIYRDFPTKYRSGLGQIEVPFSVVSVRRDGSNEPWHTKEESNGVRVYVGSASTSVPPGEHTYEIRYRTSGQLGFFDDHDELYWNVTGNGWVFRIEKASASVHLPSAVPLQQVRHEGYTGRKGSKETDYRSAIDYSNRTIDFETTRPLGSHEGLTIVVSWPKGYVREPTAEEKRHAFFRANVASLWAVGGIVLVLLYYLAAWIAVGRDPRAGTIIPEFAPPDGIGPAGIRHIHQMGVDNKCFTVAVIDMAVKGFLTIEEESGEFTLKKKDASKKSALTQGEKTIADSLLKSASSFTVKKTNWREVREAVNGLSGWLKVEHEGRVFLANRLWLVPGIILSIIAPIVTALQGPDPGAALFASVWLSIWSIGVLGLGAAVFAAWKVVLSGAGGCMSAGGAIFITLFSLPFFAGECFGMFLLAKGGGISAVILLFALLIINAIFISIMKAPTVAGRKLMDRIDGFRMYLDTAEEDRVRAMQGPEKTPELFERFLPYAIALGVENAWARKFESVLAAAGEAPGSGYQPSWYSGRALTTAGIAGFGTAIGASMSSTISSSSSAPGSSSGSGGGGSSGGGGGGGGGGGW